jgi:hypothetical protein
MSKLFLLPKYFANDFFQTWLGVKQICVLDTAFTNSTDREKLHKSIRILRVKDSYHILSDGVCSCIVEISSELVTDLNKSIEVLLIRKQNWFFKNNAEWSFNRLETWKPVTKLHNILGSTTSVENLSNKLRSIQTKSSLSKTADFKSYGIWCDSFGNSVLTVSREIVTLPSGDIVTRYYFGRLLNNVHIPNAAMPVVIGKKMADGSFGFGFNGLVRYPVAGTDGIWTVDCDEAVDQLRSKDRRALVCFDCLPHGYGFAQSASGNQYKGLWRDGLRQGRGTVKYISRGRNIYEGSWVDDMRGVGELRCRNQNDEWTHTYSGAWQRNMMWGISIITFASGVSLSGEWGLNMQDGTGTLTLPGLGKFRGSFLCGYLVGDAEVEYENGDTFKGVYIPFKSQYAQTGALDLHIIPVECNRGHCTCDVSNQRAWFARVATLKGSLTEKSTGEETQGSWRCPVYGVAQGWVRGEVCESDTAEAKK